MEFSLVECEKSILPKNNGRWSRNIANWLNVDLYSIGCWTAVLEAKRSGARPMVQGSISGCEVIGERYRGVSY